MKRQAYKTVIDGVEYLHFPVKGNYLNLFISSCKEMSREDLLFSPLLQLNYDILATSINPDEYHSFVLIDSSKSINPRLNEFFINHVNNLHNDKWKEIFKIFTWKYLINNFSPYEYQPKKD